MTQAILAASSALHISALLDFFRDLKRKHEQSKKVRSTIKELSKLSDRELNDIGIARGDIYAIAHEDKDYARFADTNSNLKGWV
jgi:uncharacterized protein YjiS (DUF1127 family)